MNERLASTLNSLGLLAISFVLLFAFYAQFADGELPCPLCLLQRAGFVMVGVGLSLNIILGVAPQYYGLMIAGAVAGGVAALRQVALHVVPGTGAYGDAFFGLHFYTWAFLVFALVILGSAVMLMLGGFSSGQRRRLSGLGLAAVVVFMLASLGNGISTVAECGLGLCPDNPVSYEALDSLLGR
ncbi:disulfide bond formation protein B [Martelella limonii]|uniref:disulfide bond formation protein B n=1 Tax=Martelella limonii TaxID=1647649 RepID=UPI0015804B94|nr:disulfide bond formation protein B [Martelella limonii]